MLKNIADLAKKNNDNEDGAISVDWVVITAAIAGLSVAIIASISSGANTYDVFE